MNADLIRRRMREVHATWSPDERAARAQEGRRRIRELLKLLAPVGSRPVAIKARCAYYTAR
jgi:hypothetical protein